MMSGIRARILHDKPVLPGLVMTAVMLSLPNLAATFWPSFDHRHAEIFWTGFGLVMLPCLLPWSARKAMLLWLPFAAFIPANLIYLAVTGSPPREWAFVVLLETDWRELERYWWCAIASVALAPFAVWLLWRIISRHLPRDHRVGWPLGMVILLFSTIIPLRSFVTNSWEIAALDTQRKASATFPVGLAVSAASAWHIRHQWDSRRSIALDVDVTSPPPAGREIHVLVIGESARFASFQVNGYGRETTPLLAQTGGLMSFQDVTAPATVTLMSVPVLLTGSTAKSLRQTASLPSVITLFRRAGFHTAWFSTQKKHGMYDTSCSLFSIDADESRFLSGSFAPGAGPYASGYDGELLGPLRELASSAAPKLFVVLHTMGSHQHYCDRYPPEFNHFQCPTIRVKGSLLTGNFSDEEKKNLTDAYDNSIRYSDWVLSQVIEILATTHAVASVFYVADHGQNSGASPFLPFAHGTMTPDVLHVPLLVWLSREYRQLRPSQTAALESHVATPFSADITFHTLLDMAGLDCRLLDHSRSIAGDSFRRGPRWVRDLSGNIVDLNEKKDTAK